MRLLKTFTCLVAFFGVSASLFSQCVPNSYQALDANKVKVQFNNSAEAFWDLVGNGRYQVPKTGAAGPVFAASLWVGGTDSQGALRVSASTYRQSGSTFLAGPYRRPVQPGCNFVLTADGDMCPRGLKQLSSGKILLLHEDGINVYDPVTAQVLARPFAQARTKLDAIELKDGRVLIFGDNNYPNKNPLLILDTLNFQFTTGPTLVWFHQESRAIQLDSGKVLFAGVIGCELYDPLTNTSVAVPDMLSPKMNFAIAKLDNGDVMAFGGGSTLSGTGNSLTVQRFDDSLGYWFPGPTMSAGRNRPEVTKLNDGTFLVSGGNGSGTKITDIFDPQTMTMSIGSPFPFLLNRHSIVRYANGDLFVSRGTAFLDGPSLFNFRPSNGTWSEINIQRTGPQIVDLGGDECLMSVENARDFEIFNINTGVQKSSRWQYVWKLNKSEIDQFRADYMGGTVDFANYPNIESWPAHGDENLGEDRNLAPFIDVNMDGLYRPLEDGDYPCIVGDQAVWYVFNDQGSSLDAPGPTMGLQVEAMAYEFDCNQTQCPDTSVDYALFMHYEITNQSDSDYTNVFIGNLQDVDLGSWTDDFVGCDSTLGLGFVYNGDNQDGVAQAGLTYGLNPPAWGSAVLDNGQISEMSAFMFYENNFDSIVGNPTTSQDYYNYMQAKWQDGSHLVNNGGDGNPNSAPGPNTNYIYPSTEGFCGGFLTGWSEITAANQPFDRRYLQSFGPIDIPAGEKIQLDLVFPYARNGNHTEAVCALKNATTALQTFWQNQIDRSCFNIVVGIDEMEAGFSGLKVWPNPSGGLFQIEADLKGLGKGDLKVFDLSGRQIWAKQVQETEQNWMIDASEWPKGLYVVQLQHESGIFVSRVLLQ